MPSSRDVIERMNAKLDEVLVPLAVPGGDYALLDFPLHSNVGDSAIWLGEVHLLRRLTGRPPVYVCAQHPDWEVLDSLGGDCTLFLHGGGNLGDIWPLHQDFREKVIDRYRERRIVQLPQTLQFHDPSALERMAALVRRSADLTILLRDARSYRVAESAFECALALCPDSAFALGSRVASTPTRDLLLLLRSDAETSGYLQAARERYPELAIEDWLEEPADVTRKAGLRALGDRLRRLQLPTRRAMKPGLFERLAEARVARGLAQLSTARAIVSDRLHVHILSTLLDIPHSVLDNNYGKISGMIETWELAWDGVELCATLEEAVASARASLGAKVGHAPNRRSQ